jgi:sugar phosphate isomerase/epimerase
MRYGIASWDYPEPGVALREQVQWWADRGFDAVSFEPDQLLQLTPSQRDAVCGFLAERDLTVTVHGSRLVLADTVRALQDMLGDRLLNVTMNPVMWGDSRGTLLDARRMGRLLGEICAATEGTPLHFGIEDFPRDELALEFFREDLEGVLSSPRFGTIIDLGHMNLWLQSREYYRGVTPASYLAGVPVPILEVHVHDNAGQKDDHGYLGFGNMDVRAVADGLRGTGFDAVCTIEVSPASYGASVEEGKLQAAESLQVWKANCDRHNA